MRVCVCVFTKIRVEKCSLEGSLGNAEKSSHKVSKS